MKFTIEYDDRDTTPEHLIAMAKEHGITPEHLIHRAINAYMGDYGVKPVPPDSKPKNLQELFIATGVMKA